MHQSPNEYALAAEAVALHTEPTIDSRKTVALKAGSQLEILHPIPGNPDPDAWVMVRVVSSNEIGWLQWKQLGLSQWFRRIESWSPPDYNDCPGETCTEYSLHPDGSFSYDYYRPNDNQKCPDPSEVQTLDGDLIRCSGNGHAYRYKDLIWLRHFGQDGPILFFRGSLLCIPYGHLCDQEP